MTNNFMPDNYDPAQEINFEGDQDDWDEAPEEMKDHMLAAFAHKAGHGRHPGHGPHEHHIREGDEQLERQAPTESHLRSLIEEEHPGEAQELLAKRQAAGEPTPAQETMEQPPRAPAGRQGAAKPPSKGTPAAIGHETVQEPPPAGEF